jgi:hypothetical protein
MADSSVGHSSKNDASDLSTCFNAPRSLLCIRLGLLLISLALRLFPAECDAACQGRRQRFIDCWNAGGCHNGPPPPSAMAEDEGDGDGVCGPCAFLPDCSPNPAAGGGSRAAGKSGTYPVSGYRVDCTVNYAPVIFRTSNEGADHFSRVHFTKLIDSLFTVVWDGRKWETSSPRRVGGGRRWADAGVLCGEMLFKYWILIFASESRNRH